MALLLMGCGAETESQTTVRVAAASSLRAALEAIIDDFESQHPEFDVVLSTAASGVLRRQIERGNEVELFISANERHMQALVDAGLVETPMTLCGNRLLVGTPAGEMITLEDLMRPDIERIAIGNPATAPLGEYTQSVLEGANIWEVLEPRLVFAENAGQLAAYLRLDSVDAAVVYASDWVALGHTIDVTRMIGEDSHDPIRYPMAVVTAGEGVTLFMGHLLGEDAQRELNRWGFRNAS